MSELDADIQPSSDSFWEVGQYKTTVKRLDDGFRSCNELMSLVQERCEIEKAYAKSLKHWAKKWSDTIAKGPEYGTTQAAWRGILEESERVNEVHCDVKNDLITEAHTSIKLWQKENYHKNMMGVIKESKDFDDNFRRAQKPWAKRLGKVIKCKKEYHTCCKTEKSLKVQLANAKGDSSVTPENNILIPYRVVKKAQDKVEKSERDTELSKDKYNAALGDLNSYNAKYMEEMSEVYEHCQEFEEKRLQFFKETMFTIHTCLNISAKEKFPVIYDDLHATIEKTDSSQDLKWWTNTFGTGMPMNWPTFEEYSPELKPINKSKASTGDGGITLRGIKTSSYNPITVNNHNSPPTSDHQNDIKRDSTHETVQSQNNANKLCRLGSYDDTMNPFSDDNTYENVIPVRRQMSYDPKLNPFGDDNSPTDNNVNPQNPFGDDWDTGYDLTDDGSPGIPVRALYDYAALEEDELNLKAGDIFHRLSEEDGQGWCKGRKDGRLGLYPANYADSV